jgi:hypothetical protein
MSATADTDRNLDRKTDGNDDSRFTLVFLLEGQDVPCTPAWRARLGQNWHCLRKPHPSNVPTPVIPIDLPVRERNGVADLAVPHVRYAIAPNDSVENAHLMWIFQVPSEVIEDHSDVFNSRAPSLVLALIQISGALASIADRWENSFER